MIHMQRNNAKSQAGAGEDAAKHRFVRSPIAPTATGLRAPPSAEKSIAYSVTDGEAVQILEYPHF